MFLCLKKLPISPSSFSSSSSSPLLSSTDRFSYPVSSFIFSFNPLCMIHNCVCFAMLLVQCFGRQCVCRQSMACLCSSYIVANLSASCICTCLLLFHVVFALVVEMISFADSLSGNLVGDLLSVINLIAFPNNIRMRDEDIGQQCVQCYTTNKT